MGGRRSNLTGLIKNASHFLSSKEIFKIVSCFVHINDFGFLQLAHFAETSTTTTTYAITVLLYIWWALPNLYLCHVIVPNIMIIIINASEVVIEE